MKWLARVCVVAIAMLSVARAPAAEMAVEMPGEVASAVVAADGTEGVKLEVDGKIVRVKGDAGRRVTIEVTMQDGVRVRGVDMAWYRPAKVAEGAEGTLEDEDRAEIGEILTVPSFYDKVELLALSGDADRATGLAQLVRDRDFHAGRGEVIWRVELWYFEFANGGWVKVAQQNKVLDRQRFASADAYRTYTQKLRLAPKLGGLELKAEASAVRVAEEDLLPVGERARQIKTSVSR